MTKQERINEEIKRYFGDRYYDEYYPNAITGREMEKIRKLIEKCIEINEAKDQYIVTFYNTKEEIIEQFKSSSPTNPSDVFNEVKHTYGCKDDTTREINGKVYGYISKFECFGRFTITDINYIKCENLWEGCENKNGNS